MALIVSAATGNFNAGATWVGGVVPTIGDEAQAANGHTITITANAACDLVSNTGTGIFTLASGVTLTANVTNKSATTSRNCLQFTAASPAVGTIIGNCTGGTAAGAVAVYISSSGTLNVTGNVSGGTGATSYGLAGNGTANITGNVTGGIGASQNAGIELSNASARINVTGNVTGGSGNASNYGIWNLAAGIVAVTGNVSASSAASGVLNATTGTITISGLCSAGANAPGASNTTTGTIKIGRAVGNAYGPGNTSNLTAAPGAANVGLGVIEIEGLEYGTFGQSPTTGTGIRLKKANTNVAVFNYCDSAGAKTLIDATQNAAMPAATDVRSGVSYASGELTGSAFIPSPSSVASGVPVDATTGTAVLTLANVQSALTAQGLTAARAGALDNLDTTVSSRLSPSGTLATVTNLTNAPASVTPSDIWSHASRTITGGTVDTLTNAPSVPSAASIRAEIDSNSTQLAAIKSKTDNLPASPAATGDIPSANITAIKAKTDLLVTDRLAQCSTVATTGAQLAAALS